MRSRARRAAWAICRGVARLPGMTLPSRGSWLISQFWQKVQRKLQPAVAMENARLPGWKWKSGFFSIGSTFCEIVRS